MLFSYPADSIEDVKEVRRAVREVLMAGGIEVTQWSSENTTVQKTRGISLQKLMDETLAYLQINDPATYGARIKRLSPFYTGL